MTNAQQLKAATALYGIDLVREITSGIERKSIKNEEAANLCDLVNDKEKSPEASVIVSHEAMLELLRLSHYPPAEGLAKRLRQKIKMAGV